MASRNSPPIPSKTNFSSPAGSHHKSADTSLPQTQLFHSESDDKPSPRDTDYSTGTCRRRKHPACLSTHSSSEHWANHQLSYETSASVQRRLSHGHAILLLSQYRKDYENMSADDDSIAPSTSQPSPSTHNQALNPTNYIAHSKTDSRERRPVQ